MPDTITDTITDTINNNLSINTRETVFVEKYRPKNIKDIVLPVEFKNSLEEWKAQGEIPNLLLVSKGPGMGKTSLCHVIAKELDAEIMFINASLESNIDLLRDKIKGFVSTASWDNRPKIVVLDEADGLNERSTQPALRAFIEEFSKSARFILTANHKNKIIEQLRDRLMDFDFDKLFKENKLLIKDIYLRCEAILNNEKIKYDKDDLKYLVKHYYPSQRSIIMKLQQFTTAKVLKVDHNEMDIDNTMNTIRKLVLDNKFEEMRKLLTNIVDPSILFSNLYEHLDDFPESLRPPIVMIIAKYQANDGFVRDRVINVAAMITEIMMLVKKQQ